MIALEFFTMDVFVATAHFCAPLSADFAFIGEKPAPAYFPVIMGALLIALIVWRKRCRDKK